jgi:signal transduction histidine kinase
MMEEKLINNEESKKFSHAVNTFFGGRFDNPVETYLLLPLMFYLAKEHMLKIMEGENANQDFLILASIQNTHLLVEKKDLSPTIEEMILFSQKSREFSSITYKNELPHLLETAEIFTSLSEIWYKENAITAFEYILERCFFRRVRNNVFRVLLPKEMTQHIKLLLDAKGGTVYNPFAGFGELLKAVGEDTIYHAQEESISGYIVQLRLLLKGQLNATVQMTNPMLNWLGKNNPYDYIVSNISDIGSDDDLQLRLLAQIAHDSHLKGIGIFGKRICCNPREKLADVINKILEEDILETVIQLPPIYHHGGQLPIVIVINKMKERPGLVHFVNAVDCSYNTGASGSVLDIKRIIELLKDDSDKLHQVYARNESIIENNYDLNPSIYLPQFIPSSPAGFQLIPIKDFLTPCEHNKTISTEGLCFHSAMKFEPYSVLDYSDLPQIDAKVSGTLISHDFLAVNPLGLRAWYIKSEKHKIIVTHPFLYAYKLDTSRLLPSYLLTEMSKEYFHKQAQKWRYMENSLRISSVQFLELKILVPDKFEDQVTLALEAGNKDLKEHWKQLEEQYQKKFEDFRNGQRQRKHAVAQVLNSLSPAIKVVKKFVEDNDNFGPNSIVSARSNTTLLAYMQAIQHHLNRVVDMVDNFTNSEKYGEAENIQINEFLEDYCMHQRVNEKYRITLDTSNDIYWTAPSEEDEDKDEEGIILTIKMGRAELTLILDNLITNANKHGFTDSNRTDYEIRLTTEVVTEGTPKLLLKVANNGEPVSRSIQLEQLFTWGITNAKTPGTGLGCWKAKELAERYNGTLTYQEHPNDENGFVCEFTLSLPLDFD